MTSHLEAFLDEALPPARMAEVEEQLRNDPELAKQLAEINRRRDAGLHSLGEIWRRHRLTCPSREELGSYLLGVLDDDYADYVKFHIHTAHCRQCRASIEDLESQQMNEEVTQRRQKYFQSSIGHLGNK